MSSLATAFAPMKAQTGKDIQLAMQRLVLTGQILPVGARLIVNHVFKSAERVPVEVIYAFGLPRDAALRRFRLSGNGFSVRSELKPVAEASALYERGIEAGHLAGLVREYSDGIVNLTVGNVRPGEVVNVSLEILAGVDVQDDGLRFRFPFTLAPCYHPRARAAVTEDGLGELELPEDEFGDLILPKYAEDAAGLHEVGFELSVCLPQPACELASPSHPVKTVRRAGRAKVSLAPEKDVPNRDLVLDVRTEKPFAGALAGIDREERGRFAAIVPSASFADVQDEAPRRIVFVLDRSGSMAGDPIQQAQKAIQACLGALSARDLFGIVAFDDRVEVFRKSLAPGTRESREAAGRFLQQIGARGGTDLAAAVSAGARVLGDAGGDLLVVTDGQVYSTDKIIAQAQKEGARVHLFGIGSASQDRFLALLARKTGGVSRFLTPRERVDMAAVDLFASIGRPLAGGIQVTAEAMPGMRMEPAPAQHVFSGVPLVIFGETDAACDGRLLLRWDGGGPLAVPVKTATGGIGETLRLLQGAKLITETEEEGELERLSRRFGLASRMAALVAVVEREGDKSGAVPMTHVVPVGMPQDTRFGSYFGRAAMPLAAFSQSPAPGARPSARARLALRLPSQPPGDMLFECSMIAGETDMPAFAAPPAGPPPDLLMDEAARMEPDGGLPGGTPEDRVVASTSLLLRFLAEGNSPRRGPFRRHVGRLIQFLEAQRAGLAAETAPLLERVLRLARSGGSLAGDWEAADPRSFWRQLQAALDRTGV